MGQLTGLTVTRWGVGIGIGAVLLIISTLTAIRLGPSYDASEGSLWGIPAAILWNVRLPRVLAALLVGWALATAGALYQGMLQNPLADPYLLGVSGGAALGVTLAMGWRWHTVWLDVTGPTLAAFAGALVCTALIYRLARIRGHLPVYGLVLAGVVLNAIASAIILLVTVTREFFQVQYVALWLMGQVQPVSYPLLAVAALWIGFWTLRVWRDAPYLNLLMLGEDVVIPWGLSPDRLRTRWLVNGAALAAMAVALAGMVGFVGLIVPHLVRLWVGSDFRRVLPLSTLAGAALLIWADTAARTLWYPVEVPVGVLTATLAGPYFLWLMRRHLTRSIPI